MRYAREEARLKPDFTSGDGLSLRLIATACRGAFHREALRCAMKLADDDEEIGQISMRIKATEMRRSTSATTKLRRCRSL